MRHCMMYSMILCSTPRPAYFQKQSAEDNANLGQHTFCIIDHHWHHKQVNASARHAHAGTSELDKQD